MDGQPAATSAPTRDAEAFYKELERNHLVALWSVNKSLLPKEPRSRCVPHLWRWETMLPLVRQGAEVAPLSRAAERRVLGFINPGLPDRFGATHTLWAGFQYVLPGEVAPAHRHSPAAIRFVIEGQGAFTTVDGDKCVMERGDLVLTPPWTWHDHGNDSDRPMLWLDGLDLPMVGEMEGQFYEPFAEDAQPIGKPVGDSERRYGIGQLRPTWETWTASHSPLLNYKWDRTEEALRRLASVAGGASPFDDVAMEYVNPNTGGPLMPTIACWIQLLRPGVRTKAHRETGSAVYLVFEGQGQTRDRRPALRLAEGRPLRGPDVGLARARQRRRGGDSVLGPGHADHASARAPSRLRPTRSTTATSRSRASSQGSPDADRGLRRQPARVVAGRSRRGRQRPGRRGWSGVAAGLSPPRDRRLRPAAPAPPGGRGAPVGRPARPGAAPGAGGVPDQGHRRAGQLPAPHRGDAPPRSRASCTRSSATASSSRRPRPSWVLARRSSCRSPNGARTTRWSWGS